MVSNDPARIRKANTERAKQLWIDPDKFEGLLHYTLELNGEVGELTELIKKINRRRLNSKHKGRKFKARKTKAIEKEIADVYLALDLVAAHFGVDMTKIVIDKFNNKSKQFKSDIRL